MANTVPQLQSAQQLYQMHSDLFRIRVHPISTHCCSYPFCWARVFDILDARASSANNQRVHEGRAYVAGTWGDGWLCDGLGDDVPN